MNNLAVAYQSANRLDRALPLYEETLALKKVKLGPDHPETLATMSNLGRGYQYAGQLDRALPLLEETLALQKARLGPDHPDTLDTMNNLATSYQDAGQLDLALPLLEETVARSKAKLGPDHPDTLGSMGNLALGYRAAGQPRPRVADPGRSRIPLEAEEGRAQFARIRERPGPARPGPARIQDVGPGRIDPAGMPGDPGIASSPTIGQPSTPGRCSAGPCSARSDTTRPNPCSGPVTRG